MDHLFMNLFTFPLSQNGRMTLETYREYFCSYKQGLTRITPVQFVLRTLSRLASLVGVIGVEVKRAYDKPMQL